MALVGARQDGAMVRLLGYTSRDPEDSPKEIVKNPSASGDSGWLIRFFDSEFFCEWIAVSYLYKHEHSGVRDYLCNRMYTLPLSGIENYLFQLCYMLVRMPCPSLERYIIDMCGKSLRIAIKVHWFLLAEADDAEDSTDILKVQEKCQDAALNGGWPPLIRPQKSVVSASTKGSRVFKAVLSSRRLLPISSSSPSQRTPPSLPTPIAADEGFRETTRGSGEETESSLKALKKFIPTSTSKVRNVLLKPFRDKEEKEDKEDDEVVIYDRPVKESDLDSILRRSSKEIESDGFFKRFFKDKDDDEKGVRSEELANPEGFFRRLFREKSDGDDKVDDEKEGFFRRMMLKKPDDEDEDESSEFTLFRKFFRQVHPEVDKMIEANPGQEHPVLITAENGPAHENFLKRFSLTFKEEGTKLFSMKRDGEPPVAPSSTPSGFLRRLFKERNDEEAGGLADEMNSLSLNSDNTDGSNEGNFLQDTFRAFRGKVRTHDSETLGKELNLVRSMEVSGAELRFDVDADEPEMIERESQTVNEKLSTSSWKLPSTDSSFFDLGKSFIKRPGSPKRRTEKASTKPPLPKYSASNMRKGVYQATLDLVQSLCDTSSGLVDCFPMEDRLQALRESVAELNQQLVAAESDGGVCFPMGKGLYRVVHIPVDECVLLNSRDKAPYLICIEVLRCETKSQSKDQKQLSSGTKTAKGGIPLANGDAQLQRPPPWAYPLQPDVQQANTQQLLRSASKAIDVAMAHLWESKLKVVDVSFSVQSRKPQLAVLQTGSCSRIGGDAVECRSPSTCTLDGSGLQNHYTSLRGEVGGATELNTRTHDKPKVKNPWGKKGKTSAEDEEWVSVVLSVVPGVNMEDIEEEQPTRSKDHRRVPSTIAMAEVKAAVAEGEAPAGLPVKKSGTAPTQTEERLGVNGKATDALAGELWEKKRERIRKTSKWSSSPDWDLRSMIVKSGDDCRQEHLAVQLIGHFYDIFQEAGLPLWLRPYEVIVTSSHTALIETIYDTASIHSIKSRNSDVTSLREFFCKKYVEGSPAFKLAQRNFVESMAGYSILCYILQVKDRHNSNLLIDEDGHIIHIDFGFMLSNSPGGVNFESAPFKLTRELLEVMDSDAEGTASEFYDYFKVLCIQGFLTCRKHAERIILLVEMMQDSGCPCFKGGPRTVQNLRKRFHLSLTEEQCVSSVLELIAKSLDAWRTRQYDYYQKVLNGIL
ncbi:phosphatidylinositol 4-kinase beta 1 isoform X2 [Physcomitrium patens]|uniref:1-phosphatidylinositol 4-kinase n=1 Tax=Physcomitrium patens TaxID=3218 RepID=A0A7I4E4T7_PHYPA|nr:phosphatidylinositol 4-kinase beta 1-like isoform X2 [Physcomitrium patens]|eukprot:XP_024378951.1 phosphatidylinositol 4-kinase beta 1-like isoform X2 [Physcomitrella patens]